MITHRQMTLADLETVLDWAAAEGWNPGLDDARAFLAADPQGFFVAEDNGQPVAAISVVNHSNDFAFLGLYLCRPSHRGRGIGYALWQHALAHAGDRTVGLDGVADQQANYAASGFIHAGGTTRYSGTVDAVFDPYVQRAEAADLDALIALEAQASGVAKPRYLRPWCSAADTRETFLLRDAKGLTAACTARRCRDGAKVGPLIAASQEEAARLLGHAAFVFGPDLTLDVPAASEPLADLCETFDLAPGFRTARMYRGPAPSQGAEIYAVATLELG
jgi:predicted N-acetyltransferase YhbS